MRILAIETSCDESAVAIIDMSGAPLRPRIRVRANVVSSQMKLHAKFGGVVPSLAKREHQKNLVPVLVAALRSAGLCSRQNIAYTGDRRYMLMRGDVQNILEREPELLARFIKNVLPLQAPKIDAIAVTVGPGLAPALWVGVNFARALSCLWRKPLIPVNHLEGHVVTNLLQKIRENPNGQFPISNFRFHALCLIVSGGHTELVLMQERIGGYRVIGETRDDAAGEAFDKVAKMMRLGFPGGPIISKLAERGDATAFPFPRPMMRDNNFDFSFSGLKTAVLYTLEKLEQKEIRKLRTSGRKHARNFSFSRFLVSDVCASFQAATVDVLVAKTVRAARRYRAKTVVIGGGVAANTKLRHDLASAVKKLSPVPRMLFPSVSLTGDNALMIALAGWFNRKKKRAWTRVQARANLRLDQIRNRHASPHSI